MANYEHYKIFCKIVECQSISKAAEKLYVSQPAISLAIKQLESSLNVKLFFRTQRGVNLTTEGKVLYDYVKQGCNIIRAGEEKLKEFDTLETGEISVGASDMTLRFFLLPFMEKFRNDFPSLKIKITNSPTPETLQHLKEGTIDFGVVSEPFDKDKDNSNFNFKPVKLVQDILIAGKSFKDITDLNAKDLPGFPFIMLERGTSTRLYIENYLKENNAPVIPDIELATSDLIIEFIKRGMGIGFMLENYVTNELANGTLHKINLTPELKPRQFYIVTHAKLPINSAAKKLLEFNDIDISDITYDFSLF
jgi:DNA-binding transcriptional LysR family regulator